MPQADGFAEIRQGGQMLPQSLDVGDGEGECRHGTSPGRVRHQVREPLTGQGPERFDKNDFGLAMVPVTGGVFCKSPGHAEFLPPCGPVAGTGKTGWIDKGFRQGERMAVYLLPIIAEALQSKAQLDVALPLWIEIDTGGWSIYICSNFL